MLRTGSLDIPMGMSSDSEALAAAEETRALRWLWEGLLIAALVLVWVIGFRAARGPERAGMAGVSALVVDGGWE